MGKHAKDILLALFDGIDEKNLQQGKVQVEERNQDAAPYQHPNNIGMNEGWRDLGVMKELLEKGRKGKAEPRIELLLGEVHGIVSNLLYRHGVTLY